MGTLVLFCFESNSNDEAKQLSDLWAIKLQQTWRKIDSSILLQSGVRAIERCASNQNVLLCLIHMYLGIFN